MSPIPRTPFRRRAGLLIAALLACALAPARAHAQADTLVLVWTAPGDDANVGTASSYEMRMSTSPITSTNWDQAALISGLPSPRPSGARERITVNGLTKGTTYYFAIKSIDDAGNVSTTPRRRRRRAA
jgi:hypothetical protein